MKAKVTCPNGHRFHVDASHLGKKTCCPQEGCGIEFMLEADPDSPIAEYAGGQQAPVAQPADAPQTTVMPMPPQTLPVGSGGTRSGMAVGSMICGIIGLVGCPLVGIAGVILGIVAVTRASRRPAEYGGKGMAIAGICTGSVSILLIPLMISILLPSLARARELSKRTVCATDLRGIGQAMKMYASDNNEAYPPDFKTLVKSGAVIERMFVCPSSTVDVADIGGDLEACYAYIKGQGEWNDASNVLVYEKPDHHSGEGGNVLFGNGTVQFIQPYSRIEELVRETKERMKHAKRVSTTEPAQR